MKLNIFLHLPKTAGSSIWEILDLNYSNTETLAIGGNYESVKDHLSQIGKVSKDEISELKIVKGHFKYGIHESFPHDKFSYFTILRNPYTRVLSHYNFVLQMKGHQLHETVIKERMTFRDYIESGVTEEVNNGMTRLLSGYEELLQKPYPESNIRYGSNDNEMLQKASHNLLNNMAGFGIQESFKDSLYFMKNSFQLKNVKYVAKNITSKNKDALSLEEKQLIKKYNALDIELYEIAKQKFNQRVSRQRLKIFFFNLNL